MLSDAAVASIPLPKFSSLACQHLKEGKPELVWNKLIAETAEYYHSECPGLSDATHYRAIGEKMYQLHPCIRQEGVNPWVS